MKHTPGPWKVKELPGGHNFLIVEEEGGIDLGNIGDILPINNSGCLSGNEIMANAHLVSAAPDMLEALQEAKKMYEEVQPAGGYQGVYEYICSSIKKALNK